MGTPENLSQGKLHLIKVTTPEWDTATEILLNNFSNLKSTTEKYDLKKKKKLLLILWQMGPALIY